MNYKKIRSFARKMRKEPTPAEEYFWQKVRGRQFKGLKFNRQFIVPHRNATEKVDYFIVDFRCSSLKLVVEVDGGIHKTQKQRDDNRDAILNDLGYQVLRFGNKEVLEDWETVAEKLEEFINKT